MDCLMKGSGHGDTLTCTKVEIEEHDTLSRMKVEPPDDGDVLQHHKPGPFGDIIGKHSTNIGTAKYELGTLHLAVVKTEHDPLEFEHGHTKEEPDVNLHNETSSNSNMETPCDDVDAGPSSSCELKSEEVHFDVLKMEEDEYTDSDLTEMEDERSGDRSMHSSKTFSCVKCERKFPRKYCLDGHIVTLHSNEADMMKTVTCKIRRCNHCPYVTVYASSMSQHIRMHEDPLDCTKCKTEFSSKLSLDGHIVSQHADNTEMMKTVTSKIRRCNRCEYVTVYASSLSRHIRMHKNPLDCSKCKKETCTQHVALVR